MTPSTNPATLLKIAGVALALTIIMAPALAGCRLPGSASPTPFVFITPDRTLTAIFAPLLTLTPQTPQVLTATPASTWPSPLPTPTPTATIAPSATSLPTDAPAPSPTRPAPKLRPAALVEAIFLENAPVLDGMLDEWSMTSFPVHNLVHDTDAWLGPADASASAMLGWDEAHLYLAVQVRDDRYVQEASGVNIFKGDSLEVLFDADLGGDFDVRSLNGDDFQLGISPGSPYPGSQPQAYLWYPASQQSSRPEVSIAARAREGGYHVEAAIPWRLLGITPHAGDAFGFALAVSDNDLDGQQVQQSMASNVSTRILTDPTTWGSLVLREP